MVQSWRDVEEKARRIISEHLGVERSKVTPSADIIHDLGADSLDAVELVMAFEEEFGIMIPDDLAEKLTTVASGLDYYFTVYASRENEELDLTATMIAFRVRPDGSIEVGLKGTDGSWVYADGTTKLPAGIYLAVSNEWGPILQELESMVNDPRTNEADLQHFFERYPALLQGDEYDRVIPQAVIKPDDRRVNWRADFVLHPTFQTDFCKILELKLPDARSVKDPKSGHNAFYYEMHKAVEQLRDYGSAFSSSVVRNRFSRAYGVDVFKPDLQLVIGRKWEVAHVGTMLERQRRDGVGIIDWDTLIEKLERKFT